MLVVSDTTPIIALMKIGRLDLLQKMFGMVLIPQAVFDELTGHPSYADEASLIRNTDFVQVHDIVDVLNVSKLMSSEKLDRGESESIQLAKEIGADFLLIDEYRGRRVANKFGVKITGTIGILLTAYDEKIMTKEEVIYYIAYMQNSHIHLSKNLLATVKKYLKRG